MSAADSPPRERHRRWRLAARAAAAAGVNLLFPPECQGCGAALIVEGESADASFCSTCLAELVWRGPGCVRCAAPVPEVAAGRPDCALCRDASFPFQSASALGPYRGPLMEAVLNMKHQHSAALGISMGRLLADRVVEQVAERMDLVIPMPMHWLRRIRRVNNPAEMLAEAVARRLEASLARGALRFRRAIRRQSGLRPRERIVNVKDAFAATSRWDLKGAAIVLVDDVMTTGATCSEASRMLLDAGAAKVWAAVAARGTGA
jgi:ComF family protein